jgi:hypothetical protein
LLFIVLYISISRLAKYNLNEIKHINTFERLNGLTSQRFNEFNTV